MDLLKLKATLGLDTSEYEQNLKGASGKAVGFGNKFKTAMKVGVAAVGAATAAIGVLTKQSVSAYAEYEQLSGGVKKLFGEQAYTEVMKFASEAYKTSGMSANKYMEQATSFSAALINSLGGDQSKAAKQTDVAMRAISDNFNTFGGDITNVQNAFQGFAKQNYTMLDNLKLGYGGTKQEMERLIADANEYAKANGMAADLSIDSFSDIVTAIDLVQQKQGIAGTTAAEASKTIEGSLNMTKAAWENLVTGFADGNADIGKLAGEVMESVGIAASNVIPAVMQAINGIGKAFNEVLPQALSAIPNLIQNVGTPLLKTGAQLVASIGKGIMNSLPQLLSVVTELISGMSGKVSDALPVLIDQALTAMMSFSETLRSGAGSLIDVGLELILNIAKGIANALPTIIQKLPQIVTNIAGVINDNAPKVLATGVKIIVTLGKGIIQAIPALIANFPRIITAIWNVITAVNWINLGSSVITAIGNGIKSVGESLPKMLKDLATKAWEAFKGIDWSSVGSFVINLIVNSIKALAGLPGQALRAIASKGMQLFTGVAWGNVGRSVIQKIGQGITAAASLVISAVKSLISKIKGYFPFNVGKIFSGWVPKIKLTTSKSGDSASTNAHSAGSVKFAKAMTKPYIFKRPTEFYAGEAGDEMLLGRTALQHDLKQAVSEASTGGDVFNIYLNYNAGADANTMLKDIARGVKRYKMAGVI